MGIDQRSGNRRPRLEAEIGSGFSGQAGTERGRRFDDAIADAGNVEPIQMQSGFVALRPTLDLGKMMSMPDLLVDARAREAFFALDEWASDNIPFPAEAYRRYIRELYQHNQLVEGTHRVAGKAVHLDAITCPTLVITASRDAISRSASSDPTRSAGCAFVAGAKSSATPT